MNCKGVLIIDDDEAVRETIGEILEPRGYHPNANVPVIVCSAYSETAKSVTNATILSKPIELKSLVQAVHAFCA